MEPWAFSPHPISWEGHGQYRIQHTVPTRSPSRNYRRPIPDHLPPRCRRSWPPPRSCTFQLGVYSKTVTRTTPLVRITRYSGLTPTEGTPHSIAFTTTSLYRVAPSASGTCPRPAIQVRLPVPALGSSPQYCQPTNPP